MRGLELLATTALGVLLLRPTAADAQSIITLKNPSSNTISYGHQLAGLGTDVLVASFGEVSRFTSAGTFVQTYQGEFGSFGASVGVLGSDILVGDPYHLVVRLLDASTGTEIRTFHPNTFVASFGAAVAAAGGNVAVGAPADGSGIGSAFLFDGATGALLHTLVNPTPEADGPFEMGDAFGASVAFLGSDVLVGAPYDNTMGPDRGAVYRFDGTTGALVQTYFDPEPPATTVLWFGLSVAEFGGDVLVGAAYTDTVPGNKAYLLDASSAAVVRSFAGGGAPVMALGGNVVGSDNANFPPHALMFDGTSGAVLRELRDPLRSTFIRLSLAGVGSNVAVGDFLEQSDAGAAYLFCGGAAGCGPCETCDASGACVAKPNPTCHTASDALMRIGSGSSQRVVFQWSGYIFGIEDFGDPVGYTNDYALCVFDSAGDLLMRAIAPAGGICGTEACWESHSEVLRYTDPEHTPDGIRRVVLRSARRGGRIILRASGDLLANRPFGIPSLPLALPVRAQVQARDTSCFDVEFTTAAANTSTRFTAKTD